MVITFFESLIGRMNVFLFKYSKLYTLLEMTRYILLASRYFTRTIPKHVLNIKDCGAKSFSITRYFLIVFRGVDKRVLKIGSCLAEI